MAAYAALVSLMQTIDEIKNHPRPPISLDEKQVHSITEKVDFLQNFLEYYWSRGSEEEEELEMRIASVAYAAEDVIESHIVNQIHPPSTSRLDYFFEHLGRVIQRIADLIHAKINICVDLYRDLERVIQNMDLIKKEVMEIVKEKSVGAQHHQLINTTKSSVSISPERPVSRMQNNTMVDFGNILNDVMYKLTRQEYNLEIVPIVGMGGIGKTTLATNIYAHPLIVQQFDVLAWVTISQEYSVREILLQVLFEKNKENQVHELGERVHKKLYGRRYLVVMDDMWSIEAWDKVKSFFPNNNNGSKIMITTRLSNIAFQLSGSHDFQMKFLDDDKSWDLLRKIVFGKECCPIELENIGKEIARNCRGLPLSIVVIGGLLTKSDMTHDYWEYTLRCMSSLINLGNKEHCLKILWSSYKELPIHLKPCFLYMGVFPEDHEIDVSALIKLWVVEGILKPIKNKSLEQVAKIYIKELVDRNLIIVHKLNWNMKATSCKFHDLLRDMCVREAGRLRFFWILRTDYQNIPEVINMERRICIHDRIHDEFPPQLIDALNSALLLRSLLVFGGYKPSPSFTGRLLRVYSFTDYYYSSQRGNGDTEVLLQQANLRHLRIQFFRQCSFPWNLQTLDAVPNNQESLVAPEIFDIWKMPHLRHVMVDRLELLEPLCGKDGFLLENLHALSINNFKCSEEVVKRIPNIKKLKLYYHGVGGLHSVCLRNLGCLQNLTSLNLGLDYYDSPDNDSNLETMQNLNFPYSLKKLSLSNTGLRWENLTAKIGSLPVLQVLKLEGCSCIGPKWETLEGQFQNLKFLQIVWCDLKCWTTEDTHFPRLEHLVLECLYKLEEIPLSIGDIPTLQSIKLEYCRTSAIASAERIKEEQLSYGNEDLQVLIEGIYGETRERGRGV